jgi:hypothetical protein
MAESMSSIGRIFLSPKEALARRYNTRIFKWTPGPNDQTDRPEHYIYCDNDRGVINRLSCSVTLYEGKWREIEYSQQ